MDTIRETSEKKDIDYTIATGCLYDDVEATDKIMKIIGTEAASKQNYDYNPTSLKRKIVKIISPMMKAIRE